MIHVDNTVSDKFPINNGVRQGDPISAKLITAEMAEIVKKADISERINEDGEHLTNLGFAYDVSYSTNKPNRCKDTETL